MKSIYDKIVYIYGKLVDRIKASVTDKLGKSEPVSWSDLKAKRDDGNLVPGQQYRITDYVATTNGDMESQSAGHPFDIIVTADDERTLNEHARAVMHETVLDFAEGMQYAAGDFCKYEGTVYKCVTAHQGEWNAGDDFAAESPYFYNCDLAAWDVWYCLDNDTNRFAWALADAPSLAGTVGRGVVYRLVDEFQNDCPYDFKGLQFKAYGDTDNVWRYTFDSGDASNNTDLSKSGLNQGVYKNTMRPYMAYTASKWALNRIVFRGENCHYNTFGSNCYRNTFGPNCSSNTFGSYCYRNTFGPSCSSNTFGSHCYYNTFGTLCNGNTFGSGCSSNTFGSHCYYNTFVSDCYGNTFGSYCYHNTFGSDCSSNTFGSYCYYNTFGSYCQYNTFGTSLSAKSYCRFVRVGAGNHGLYINPTGTTSSSQYYQNVEIKEGVNNTTTYKTIGDPNVGQTFLTTYKPADSQEVSL